MSPKRDRSYSAAISYIEGALKFGINPGLERIEAICAELGEPHKAFPAIQITGTNGKTSAAWMTGSILGASGVKEAVYTSPHLHSYRERIAIAGAPISEMTFASAFFDILPVLEETRRRFGELTEFEILTALALYLFAREGVDAVVLEVGLGGRWDATSVVLPKVAVVTNVELEHTDRLGKTVREIAWEKAHVIKDGCTAIAGELGAEALPVVEDRVREQGAELKVLDRDFRLLEDRGARDVQGARDAGNDGYGGFNSFAIDGLYGCYDGLRLSVLGEFQLINAALAVAACESFRRSALDVSSLRSGLGQASSPGRLEIVRERPLVVLDGAHNPSGMRSFTHAIERLLARGILAGGPAGTRIVSVLAVSADKDIEGILREVGRSPLGRPPAVLIVSQNESYRAAGAAFMAGVAKRVGLDPRVEPDLKTAIRQGIDTAGPDGLLLITGSLYTVAEARQYLTQAAPIPDSGRANT